jgi:hypothetical protein
MPVLSKQELAKVTALEASYPAYLATAAMDELRAAEYGYLDADAHAYLDYAGAGLPAQAQLRAHAQRLSERCFGNPHSENPASTELIERTRHAVLQHFGAPPEDYTVIFTANASAACRLVGEAYPFGRRSWLVLTSNNHNSVHGIREFARARGAEPAYVPFGSPQLRVDDDAVRAALRRARGGLFAFPAQSNFLHVTGYLMGALPEQGVHRAQLAAILFAIVLRCSANRPVLVFPQMCVKLRNANVSGRPNSTRRVFPALSAGPTDQRRSSTNLRSHSWSMAWQEPRMSASAAQRPLLAFGASRGIIADIAYRSIRRSTAAPPARRQSLRPGGSRTRILGRTALIMPSASRPENSLRLRGGKTGLGREKSSAIS